MPKLTYVVGSGGETRTVDIGDSCSIGSLAGNTILLDAALGVSRRHCQVLKIQSGYELADLGSTNGTKVNGAPVKKQKLKHGDRIEVGKVTLTFDDGSGAAAGAEDEISIEEPVGAAESAPAASASRAGAASDQCVLVFAGGDKDGQKIALDKARVTFGRNSKNSVVLTDSGASGFHAEIAREGGAYVLRDLGSTNGTLVDGEPVSETALQHGARIRMGATRFVFVDPTVSDFEKAMAAVDDLGSEWGLLRAEMDMTRVQQARRSQAIVIAVLVVVVVGGGAYVVTHPEVFQGDRKVLADVPGNLLKADPSFDLNQGTGWSPRKGTPTKARGADAKSDGPAKQGTAFYAVARDGARGTCAAAVSAESVAVSPGKPVEFGAAVRVRDGGMGGARVSWLDSAGKEIGLSASALSNSSDWQVVKGTAMPPDAARTAKLELVNASDGTAFFDDVFFVVGGSGGSETKKDQVLSITGSADGQTTVARSDLRLLVQGAVVGGALKSDAIADPARRGDRAGSQSLTSAGLAPAGTLVDPATPEAQRFQSSVSTEGGRYVKIDAALPNGEAAWVAGLPEEFMTAGVGVRSENDYRRASEPRVFEKVTMVDFGGPNRFRVTKLPECGPLKMALFKTADGWEVGFGADDGKLHIRIDTDAAALIADVEQLKNDASAAKQQGRLGIAIAKYKQLEGFYPVNSVEGSAARQEWTALEDAARAALDKAQAKAKGAMQFRDAGELRSACDEAERLSKSYAEHEFGKQAGELVASAKDAVEKLRIADDERAAEPVLKRADDFAAHKMTTLAQEFYREVVQRFPGTMAAKTAGEKLAAK